jgi:hypothetical protein
MVHGQGIKMADVFHTPYSLNLAPLQLLVSIDETEAKRREI